MQATTPTGESTTIQYIVAHFGARIPDDGLTVDLAITNPYDACSTIDSVTRGANVSSLALSDHGQQLQGTAFLSNIYGRVDGQCLFFHKAINAEAAGAALEIVSKPDDTLFYMAVDDITEQRVATLALNIPTILISNTGSEWLTARLSDGIILKLGAEHQRCSGGRVISADSGSFHSTPVGQAYCSHQECRWLVTVPSDDIIILTFSRFNLECATENGGLPVSSPHAPIIRHATQTSPLHRLLLPSVRLCESVRWRHRARAAPPHVQLHELLYGRHHRAILDAALPLGRII